MAKKGKKKGKQQSKKQEGHFFAQSCWERYDPRKARAGSDSATARGTGRSGDALGLELGSILYASVSPRRGIYAGC